MLTWLQPMVDRWVTLREVWYDRYTFRPTRSWCCSIETEESVLRAKLSNYKSDRRSMLATPADADSRRQLMAHQFDLFFPETAQRDASSR